MGAASPFLRTLPLDEYGLEWIHPPVLVAHPFDDGTAAALRASLDETAEGLGADGVAYRALMRPFVRSWKPLFDEALAPPLHLPRHPLLLARFGLSALRPAPHFFASKFRTDSARALLLGIAAHGPLPIGQAASTAFGLMLAVAGHAVGWPLAKGGSQAIAGALVADIERHGGRIVTGAPLRVLPSPGQADAVLLDVSPRQLLDLADNQLPARYARRLRAFRYGVGVFKMDWALSGPIPWTAEACRQAGTVHLGGGADEIADVASEPWRGRHPRKPFIILAQPSLFDDSRAPAGAHTAWAYCHVPNGSREDRTEAIEAQIERFAPGFRNRILARRSADTAALEAHNPNMVGGDINGGMQDLMQLVFRPVPRLDPYATPIRGVWLCSASTPPGGGVHGMCGWHAARSVLRRMGGG